jgi:hypothetical protein
MKSTKIKKEILTDEVGLQQLPTKEQIKELRRLQKIIGAKLTFTDEMGRFVSAEQSTQTHVLEAIQVLKDQAQKRGINTESGCLVLLTIILGISFSLFFCGLNLFCCEF